ESLRDFTMTAFPIFVLICVVAGLLQWSNVLTLFTTLLSPLMAAFNLPPETAIAIILGSVRKDGIAIGLLDGDWNSLKVALDTPFQMLTAVYLAGVLLPCLVTVITVAREMRPKFALKMVGRQVSYAAVFSLCIAWFGKLFFP
ncbi:MAG: nucleoside recognition domain-containing protein, partial [Verrucomicrobiota bacterium]